MALDNNRFIPQSPTMASRKAAVVVPNDSTDLAMFASRGLYVGVSGDVCVDLIETGQSITFKAVPIGILPVGVRRVRLTGTTAQQIIALH